MFRPVYVGRLLCAAFFGSHTSLVGRFMPDEIDRGDPSAEVPARPYAPVESGTGDEFAPPNAPESRHAPSRVPGVVGWGKS